jgi:hypothetical protein
MTCGVKANSQYQEKDVGGDRRFKTKTGNTDRRRALKPAPTNTGQIQLTDRPQGPILWTAREAR